jgi:HK97 family phage prohead protease
MPWHVSKSSECPESKPWACIRDSNGTVEGCHATEADARKQMAALYAQEEGNKSVQHKRCSIIETKADAEAGTFEALVAVFNNIDHGGDRIMPGAFTKTLAEWNATGDPIPVILSHQWDDPMAHVGVAYAKDMVETDRGLMVKGTLDVNDNEVAKQVHRLMQRRSLKEFSFGYQVAKGGEKRAKDGANELSEVSLIEIGPTLKGLNPATELHAVKSALGVEEPATEADLRKRTEEMKREQIEETLPDIEVTGEVIEVDPVKKPEPKPDPKSAQELRRATDQVEREQIKERLPEVKVTAAEVEVDLVAEMGQRIEALERQLAEAKARPSKTMEELRREFDQIERERVKAKLPAVTIPEGEELLTIEEARSTLVGEVKEAIIEEIKTNLAEQAERPSEQQLRKASAGVERELIAEQLPEEGPDGEPKHKSSLRASVAALEERFSIVLGRLDELQKSMQEPQVQEQAEETGREPETARPVDPLRRRSEEAVLEISTDGLSQRKPPKAQPEPEPEPGPSEGELRRLFERQTLELLTGARHESG